MSVKVLRKGVSDEWNDDINPDSFNPHVFVVNMYWSGPVLFWALCGSCLNPQLSLL